MGKDEIRLAMAIGMVAALASGVSMTMLIHEAMEGNPFTAPAYAIMLALCASLCAIALHAAGMMGGRK